MKRLKQTTALLLLGALTTGLLAGCGNDGGSTSAGSAPTGSTLTPEAENTVVQAIGDGASLSAAGYDLQAEYFYSDYNAASNADEDRQDGIDTFENTDIVFKSLYYDEFTYLLEQEGNYLILLGGSWCHNTRATIGLINEYAKEYGIDTVYNFDFRLDGDTRKTHIRESAVTPEYGDENVTAADWNYLYGEWIARYFTNLNDWVEYKEDGESALTWYDAAYNAETIAKVQVPFLFLYNKDNTTRYVPIYDEDGKQAGVEVDEAANGTYPIVYGFEEMVDKDSTGIYDTTGEDGARNYITEEYTARLAAVFDFIRDNEIHIDVYTDADYLYDSFLAGNERGRAKLYDVFDEGEQINIEVITYRQTQWLLGQEGSAVILFGGAWCSNTAASIGPINDYAVANDITVYMVDFRLDGYYPVDVWGYAADRQFETRSTLQAGDAEELTDSTFVGQVNPFAYLYTDLVNLYLTNVETITDTSSERYFITAVDDEGNEAQAARMQVPYLLAYNKDATDKDGFPAPVLAWHEEMLYISEDSIENGTYIYQTDNYASYTGGIEAVLTAYADSVGLDFAPYTGEPRQPLVD